MNCVDIKRSQMNSNGRPLHAHNKYHYTRYKDMTIRWDALIFPTCSSWRTDRHLNVETDVKTGRLRTVNNAPTSEDRSQRDSAFLKRPRPAT